MTPSQWTPPSLDGLNARVEARHEENQRILAEIKDDIAEIKVDMRSLLESRSEHRGMWRVLTVLSVVVSAVVSAAIAWIRGH